MSEKDEQLKREQITAWNDSAEGWNKWWPTFERCARPVCARIVELAGVRPGDRVLDIATGNGEPAATAARAAGPSGKVFAVDQSPGMLAIARKRAASLGFGNIEFLETDAEALSLPPASIDAIVCRWGLMFLPDLDRACRAFHAMLKPGRRLATAVWAAAPKVPMITIAVEQVRKLTGQAPPPPDALGPLRLADTSILKRALEGAGFRAIREESMNVVFEFRNADELAAFRSEIGGTRAMLARLSPEIREKITLAIIEAARQYADAAGVVRLPNETILIAAEA